MAIKLERLKEVLEGTDLDVDLLEKINSLDEDVVDDHTAQIEAARNEAASQAKAEYDARFKAAFFKGEGIAVASASVEETHDDHTDEETPEAPLTDDDIANIYINKD